MNKDKYFKQALIYIIIGLITTACSIIYWDYFGKKPSNVNLNKGEKYYLYIHKGDSFDDIVHFLEHDSVLYDINSFIKEAHESEYNLNFKPGRFEITSDMSNKDIIDMLMKGEQTPVSVTFTYTRKMETIAKKVSTQIEADSAEIMQAFNDEEFIKSLGYDMYSRYLLTIPNTYEFFWNTTAEGFWKRMKVESNRFWNEKRMKEADSIGFTPLEVITLASIVEMETSKKEENAKIAGVYMNRLKKGYKLQADPTLAFLLDWNNRRILNKHKKIDSPYNTYIHRGLPPGPICIPSIAAIDAVLNYEKHDYIFFCADANFTGYHNFAVTYSQHKKNARKYQAALNNRRIYNK